MIAAASLLEWRLDPLVSGAIAAAALAYVAAARRARRWPSWRTVAFCGGLLVLFVTLQSGLHRLGEELLSAHMVQHLLLTLVVPPLVLLGAPLTLALRALPPARGAAAWVLRGRVPHVLTRPAVGLSVFTAVLLGTHLPAFYDAAIRHEAVHALEHALLLAASLLFWLPLLGAEPALHASTPVGRILSLLLAMPPMALVGVVLLSSSTVVYDPYAAAARERGVSALADQRAGGTVMWVGGTLVLVAATLAVGWAALRREEERQRSREAYAEARRAS